MSDFEIQVRAAREKRLAALDEFDRKDTWLLVEPCFQSLNGKQ
jgi:hypothetical protein